MNAIYSLVGRSAIGTIFFWAGLTKIFAHTQIVLQMKAAGVPYANLLYYVTVTIEVGGGLLLALGARTRSAAWVLAVFLAFVTYFFHFSFANHREVMAFLSNVAIFGGLLHIVAFGAGRLSLDGR